MISVLRLDHRRERDARISTHCGLVARALGAQEIIYTGEDDKKLLESINKVAKKWGGPFRASYSKSYRKTIGKYRRRGFKILHLSMYGIPYEKKVKELRRKRNLLIVIGSEKVPFEVYQLADYNISITSQPHSEVAALAVMLAAIKRAPRTFKGAKIRIVPMERGKRVVER